MKSKEIWIFAAVAVAFVMLTGKRGVASTGFPSTGFVTTPPGGGINGTGPTGAYNIVELVNASAGGTLGFSNPEPFQSVDLGALGVGVNG